MEITRGFGLRCINTSKDFINNASFIGDWRSTA